MQTIHELIEGHRRFRGGYFEQHRSHFEQLAQSQSPRFAIVSCCDSRVDPAVIMDCAPGDLFVVRNVANLVPPCEQHGAYHGTSAALEFAVTDLCVRHIIVLGHRSCGGIRALVEHDPAAKEAPGFIGSWMSIARAAREQVFARPDLATTEERAAACEHAALGVSLANLRTFPWIRERIEAGRLALHAWFYDLADGDLLRFDEATGTLTRLLVRR